jgi:hypothetical protein
VRVRHSSYFVCAWLSNAADVTKTGVVILGSYRFSPPFIAKTKTLTVEISLNCEPLNVGNTVLVVKSEDDDFDG